MSEQHFEAAVNSGRVQFQKCRFETAVVRSCFIYVSSGSTLYKPSVNIENFGLPSHALFYHNFVNIYFFKYIYAKGIFVSIYVYKLSNKFFLLSYI